MTYEAVSQVWTTGMSGDDNHHLVNAMTVEGNDTTGHNRCFSATTYFRDPVDKCCINVTEGFLGEHFMPVLLETALCSQTST